MYVENSHAAISFQSRNAAYEAEPALKLQGVVRCPGCDCQTKIETAGYLVGGHTHQTIFDFAFRDFVASRACPTCGVVSVVPEGQQHAVRQHLLLVVTPQWVFERVAELKVPA